MSYSNAIVRDHISAESKVVLEFSKQGVFLNKRKVEQKELVNEFETTLFVENTVLKEDKALLERVIEQEVQSLLQIEGKNVFPQLQINILKSLAKEYDDGFEFNKAIECYERILDFQGSLIGAESISVFVFVKLAYLYDVNNNKDKAIEYCTSILNCKESSPDFQRFALEKLIDICRNQGHRPTNMSGEKDVLRKLKDLGDTYCDNNNFSKAIKCYECVLDLQGSLITELSVVMFNRLANAYKLNGNKDKAIEYYEKLLDSELSSVHLKEKALRELLMLYENNSLKKIEYCNRIIKLEGVSEYERKVALDLRDSIYQKMDAPGQEVLLRKLKDLGDAYCDNNAFSKAIQCYECVLDFQGSLITGLSVVMFNRLANTYKLNGNKEKAIEFYERVLNSELSSVDLKGQVRRELLMLYENNNVKKIELCHRIIKLEGVSEHEKKGALAWIKECEKS